MTSKLKEMLSRSLIAALFGGASAATLCRALRFALPAPYLFAGAFTVAVICAAAGLSRKTLFVTLPALAAAVILLKLPREYTRLFREGLSAASPAAEALTAGALAALIAFMLTGLRSGSFLMLILFGLALIFGRRSGSRIPLWTVAAAALSIVAQFAFSDGRRGAQFAALVPAAIVCTALAMAFTPAEGTVNETLYGFAEHTREKIMELTDTLSRYGGFSDDRVAYSVCMDGYQPLVSSLGGPAIPSQEAVMDVETDTKLYLRGSIRRYYTGHAWIDDSANSRYVFLDPSKKHTREKIFDIGRVSPDGSAVYSAEASVTLLKASESSALFVPHRLNTLSLDALSMVAYYNTAGEVFLTRPVEPGDRYEIDADIADINSPAFDALAGALGQTADADHAAIAADFTRLPAGIEAGVYEAARAVSAGSSSPAETVREILRYLCVNCSYELMVDYPPEDRDFVSYFLLDSRQGYCTYFASAFSVLCRACGIPARYIEGYVASPGADGIAHITGENAHAWCEVYFSGLGWVTVDPTAAVQSASGEPESGEEPTPSDPKNDDGHADATPTPPPQENTETPEDDTRDQPTEPPRDEPEDEPDEPDDGSDDEPDDDGPEDDSRPDRSRAARILAILALLAAAAVFVRLRLRRTDPAYLIRKESGETGKMAVVYRALLTELECRGIRPRPGESAEAFFDRLAAEGAVDDRTAAFASLFTRTVYSAKAPEESWKKAALGCCREAARAMTVREKLRWLTRRVFKGIGRWDAIP